MTEIKREEGPNEKISIACFVLIVAELEAAAISELAGTNLSGAK